MTKKANTLLEEALEGWDFARKGFLAEAAGIPDWSYSPHPNSRSVHDVVVHILQSSDMMVGELTRPGGDFTRQSIDEHFREHASGVPLEASQDELQALLESTLADGMARFREAGEIWMLQCIVQFNGVPATRLSWFQHGIAHEEYHRGQLTAYTRTLGLVPALTKMIHGDNAK